MLHLQRGLWRAADIRLLRRGGLGRRGRPLEVRRGADPSPRLRGRLCPGHPRLHRRVEPQHPRPVSHPAQVGIGGQVRLRDETNCTVRFRDSFCQGSIDVPALLPRQAMVL